MKLVKKEKIEKPSEVYNLHVKDDHNYIANDAVVANCHQSKATILKKMLSGPMANIPLRWGLTGTIPKDAGEKMALVTNIGQLVNTVKAVDLQDLGILSSCNINILQTQENIVYNDYQTELKYLVSNPERIEWLANKIQEISIGGNTLVLVDRKITGEELVKLIPDSVFIHGDIKQKDRKKEYEEVNFSENKVIVATSAVAATGVNIVSLYNIVLIEPGKSFVKVIQSIGRGLRKGFGKDHVEIWDICANVKYSKKHLTERKKFYNDAQYPFAIKKVYR